MKQSIQSLLMAFVTLVSIAMVPVGIGQAATLAPQPFAAPAIPVPTLTGGSVMLDLPSGSAENIILDIQQGRFANQSVGNLKLNAQGIDFRQGSLKSLGAEVKDGQFENIPVDLLKLNASAFSFDTLELLNHRRFILAKPVDAGVLVRISEANLNKYLANPKTIDRLEKAIARKTGNVALIKLTNPAIVLGGKAMGKGGGNKVKLTLNATISDLASTPLELLGTLGSNQGKLQFMDMVLSSNGMPLPVDVASILQTKLNEMIDLERLGKNNFTIRAQNVSVANHQLEVTGQAALTRLEFGQ
jgi:hypothetical protein